MTDKSQIRHQEVHMYTVSLICQALSRQLKHLLVISNSQTLKYALGQQLLVLLSK